VTAALTLGSDINAVNPVGDSALHVASAQGYDTVVRLLVERGADLNLRNTRGLTPLDALTSKPGPSAAGASPRQSTIDLLRTLSAR
jgi:ankyrin repeat protein